MSTHNICFCWEIRKKSAFFGWKESLICCYDSLIGVFIVCIKKLCVLGYPKCTRWRFWSDYANTQADLNLCWAYMSRCVFWHGVSYSFDYPCWSSVFVEQLFLVYLLNFLGFEAWFFPIYNGILVSMTIHKHIAFNWLCPEQVLGLF